MSLSFFPLAHSRLLAFYDHQCQLLNFLTEFVDILARCNRSRCHSVDFRRLHFLKDSFPFRCSLALDADRNLASVLPVKPCVTLLLLRRRLFFFSFYRVCEAHTLHPQLLLIVHLTDSHRRTLALNAVFASHCSLFNTNY